MIIPEQFTAVTTPPRIHDDGVQIVRIAAEDVPSEYIAQIVAKSRQPHVMEFEGHEDVGTPDEPGRFYDEEAYMKWTKKGRIVYFMVRERADSDQLDIGGILWFGKRENELVPPEYQWTFGIRHYTEDIEKGWGQFLGKGFGRPFINATHTDMLSTHPEAKIWADLVGGNEAASRLYGKCGYRQHVQVDDPEHGGTRIVMIHEPEAAQESA